MGRVKPAGFRVGLGLGRVGLRLSSTQNPYGWVGRGQNPTRPNPCKGLAGNEVSCQHHYVPLAIRNAVSCWYYCWLLAMQLAVGIITRWLATKRYLLLATDPTWVGFNPRVLGWVGCGLGWVTIYVDSKPIWVGWPRPKPSPTRPMSRPKGRYYRLLSPDKVVGVSFKMISKDLIL